MKLSTAVVFLAATINKNAAVEGSTHMVFPAPESDPSYQKCRFDYPREHRFACQNPDYPNCEGSKRGVSLGRCFARPPLETLAVDPRYQRCGRDFGNAKFGNECQDPDYPDCVQGFCYARSTNPMPLDPEAPRPDPSGQDCNTDYTGQDNSRHCQDPNYPICEGRISGKQWGKCLSKSTDGIKLLDDLAVKAGVVYEHEMIISHNDSDPKLTVHEGDEIAGVETWSDAFHFCLAKGRRLPYRYEWCNGKWNRYVGRDVWGGLVPGPEHKWTAVVDNYNLGTLLQLADTVSANGVSEVCKTYLPGPAVYREKKLFDPFCKKPDSCDGKECSFECPADAKVGFYPDPNDCQAVCYCSGSESGSFWEKVTEDETEVWDPWCEGSRRLDRDNVPLGGMNGGCKNKEFYVNEKSYCNGNSNEQRELSSLRDKDLIDPGYQPSIDTVMCVKSAKFYPSELNPTCAAAWGDPHIVTYDGLRYSCQGQGDHILAKSLDSGFELQGKFKKPFDNSIKGVTVMTGFHLRTGNPNEPDVEFDISTLRRKWWIGGQSNDGIDRNYGQLGTQTTGTPHLQYFVSRGVRMFYYPESRIQLKITYNFHSRDRLGRYINIELCLPDELKKERIIGLFGSPDAISENDWMDVAAATLPITDTKWEEAFNYCKENWCIEDENQNRFHNKFTCDYEYDPTLENLIKNLDQTSPLYGICGSDLECIMDGLAGGLEVAAQTERQQSEMNNTETLVETPEEPEEEKVEEEEQKRCREEEEQELEHKLEPTSNKGSGSGDPHFKTWTGDKFDYHGECDLVLVDNPSFNNGQGMKLHIRTRRVRYFSFIEKIALQIGTDVLEFANDAEKFLINGEMAEPNKIYHKTMLGGFLVRRDPNALSVRLRDGSGPHKRMGAAKIDFHTRKNGFPAVIVDGGSSDIFQGSLGLLGEWSTGKKVGRDGKTEFIVNGPTDEDGATAFALEWQVRESEPMLFHDSRFPQFPYTCTPPAKRSGRLGDSALRKEAEEACSHWKADKDDCIFDVIATRDVLVAEEGHIVHVE